MDIVEQLWVLSPDHVPLVWDKCLCKKSFTENIGINNEYILYRCETEVPRVNKQQFVNVCKHESKQIERVRNNWST